MIEIIREFEIFYPIKGKRERKFLKYLINEVLKDVSLEIQKFKNEIPESKIRSNVDLKFENSGLVSGKIEEMNIVSSIHYEGEQPNINFNPYCEDISLPSFYNAPSVAIAKKDLNKLIDVENVKIKVKVKKEKFSSSNILIGNLNNPKNLIFTHFDTVLKGAVDNSSGVSVVISIIKKFPKLLNNNLFILSGSEELSFENPYWGCCYRIFEKEFLNLIKNSKRIIVVDSLGFLAPKIFQDKKILWLAFPIRNFELIAKKTFILSSIYSKEKMKVYYSFFHSNLDSIKNLKERYLLHGLKLLKIFLNK